MDKFIQVWEFNQFHNVPSETTKIHFFPFTLKERVKDWFFTLDREFDSRRDIEDAFLRKYYSAGTNSDVRRDIHKFLQGPGEVFYEAWERLRDLLRQCPHHGIPKNEITQIFYDGLGAPDRYLLHAASGGTLPLSTTRTFVPSSLRCFTTHPLILQLATLYLRPLVVLQLAPSSLVLHYNSNLRLLYLHKLRTSTTLPKPQLYLPTVEPSVTWFFFTRLHNLYSEVI